MRLRAMVAVGATAAVVAGGSVGAYAARQAGTPTGAANNCSATGSFPGDDTQPGWSTVTTLPGEKESNFYDVSPASKDDIWALGGTASLEDSSVFVYHFTGGCWQPVGLPGDVTQASFITSSGPNNTWLAASEGSYDEYQQLLHWHDGTWTAEGPKVNAAAAQGDHLVWVAGDGFVGRYNGTSTTKYSIPDRVEIDKIRVLSTGDVWAVGRERGNPAATGQPYAVHWNGTKWQTFTMPTYTGDDTLPDNAGVTDVAGGGNDVYAVGSWTDGADYAGTELIAMHWNGTKWSKTSGPSQPYPHPWAQAAVSRHGGLWTSYSAETTGATDPDVLYRNTDGSWQDVIVHGESDAGSVPPAETVTLYTLAPVPGTDEVIGVGQMNADDPTPAVVYDE